MADNAGAPAGKTMNGYIAGTNGAVEMVHIPSHTPRLNPVETEWREIRAAIPDIFFAGLDKMWDAMIIRMLHNGEMPMVNLLGWLLPAPWSARRPSEGTRAAAHLSDYCALTSLYDSPRGDTPARGPAGRDNLTATQCWQGRPAVRASSGLQAYYCKLYGHHYARPHLGHLHRRNIPAHLRGRRGAHGRAGGIRGARLSPAASPFLNRPEQRTGRCRMAWDRGSI